MDVGRVSAFFYGSFMNLDVLRETGYVPSRVEPGRLAGFDIHIEPLATLVPSDEHAVYGIVAEATHADLARLYDEAWRSTIWPRSLGVYVPHPVLVELMSGDRRLALTYIAAVTDPAPATSAYVDARPRPRAWLCRLVRGPNRAVPSTGGVARHEPSRRRCQT